MGICRQSLLPWGACLVSYILASCPIFLVLYIDADLVSLLTLMREHALCVSL